MNAHAVVLFLHSYLRWVVLGLVLVVLFRARSGWRKAFAWSEADERTHKAFVGVLDLQLLLGLLLYLVLSPITRAFFASPGPSMKVSEIRFFGIEHITLMIVAVVVAHVGRVRSKRREGAARHKGVFITSLVTLILILAAIPWPFYPAKRPMFRTASSGAPPPAESKTVSCPPVYDSRCASCHGQGGRGDGPLAASMATRPRSFTDPWKGERTEVRARAVIREGGAPHGLSPLMPPHPDLSDAEIEALGACAVSLGEGATR
jgi:hypothetical protein